MHLDAIDEGDECDVQNDKQLLHTVGKAAIIKHKETVDVILAKREIETAREEWDQLTCVNRDDFVIVTQTPLIEWREVVDYFRSKDMNQYLKCIKPVKQRKGFDAFKYWVAGPPRLQPTLLSDRDLFFAIALCPFDTSDKIHMRVLQTLYKSLSGVDRDCPRYGKHWEDLGFQGIDPGTDLRGVGFLGLVHLLSLILNPETAALAKEISLLSQHERQNFPFCTMGINITRIVLETVREEALNRQCNSKMDIFEVTNAFYAGIFLRLFVIWKEQKKTIIDSGFVIKDLSATAKKNSSLIFKELFSYIQIK